MKSKAVVNYITLSLSFLCITVSYFHKQCYLIGIAMAIYNKPMPMFRGVFGFPSLLPKDVKYEQLFKHSMNIS